MVRKSFKATLGGFMLPEVVLSVCPGDVIRDREEVDAFIKGLYGQEIVEVFNNYYANPLLCRTIHDRSWLIKRRVMANMSVCAYTAGWVYTGKCFNNKLTVNNPVVTVLNPSVFMTNYNISMQDVIRVNGLLITSPERTLIDIIRLNPVNINEKILAFKQLAPPYMITKEKIHTCLQTMTNIPNIDQTIHTLQKHNLTHNTQH